MTNQEINDFLFKTKDEDLEICYVVILAKNNSEFLLKKIKSMGYMAFVRTTAFGEEIVVVDRICDGNS